MLLHLTTPILTLGLLMRVPTTVRRHAAVGCCTEPPLPPAPATTPPAEGTTPPSRVYSENWSGAGRFADDEPLPLSFWLLGPSPRRAILPVIGSTAFALAANLWGSGSLVLSLAPEAARKQRLDCFYPVSDLPRYPYTAGRLDYDPGFKRYYDEQGRFEFTFPARYVQDTTVFLRNADAAYTRRMLDPTLGPMGQPRRPMGPEVAFGPPGANAEENLSVVIGNLPPGFSLRGTLGAPAEAAERLISQKIAKPGVRETTLLGAVERTSARSGLVLYQFEYKVDYPNSSQAPTYTVCVVGTKRDTLYTFASRVPEPVWEKSAQVLREVADSFALL